jgi:hypothetical protein
MIEQVFVQEQLNLLLVKKRNEGLTPEEIEQKNIERKKLFEEYEKNRDKKNN